MSAWTIDDIPDQTGKLVVITGATGGLGYETALALAGKGADVVLTGRSDAKGVAALTSIRTKYPNAKVSYENLDLSSLRSVGDFAARFSAAHRQLDLLVNNGGVMALPTRKTSADGFELQFATNHLSHFALTAHLLPLLQAAPAPRVINVASTASTMGQIDFADLQEERTYRPWKAYSQSKLANLLFTFELQRHSDANRWGLFVAAAHPGFATTDLIPNGMGSQGWGARVTSIIAPLFGQSPAAGALPQLFAATDPNAKPAAYYGPNGLMEMRGAPTVAKIPPKARDTAVAAKLWDVSEKLTGVTYPAIARAA